MRCDGQRWTMSVQSGRKRAERGDLQMLLWQRNGQENDFGDPRSNQSVHLFIFFINSFKPICITLKNSTFLNSAF